MLFKEIEMFSASGQTFMLTTSMVNPYLVYQNEARIQQNALTSMRFAECGLFA